MKNWVKNLFSFRNDTAVPTHSPPQIEFGYLLSHGAVDGVKEKEKGDAFLYNGEFAAATERYRNAVVVNPNFAKAYNNLGFALKEQNQFAASEDCLTHALAIDPSIADAHYMLGVIAHDDGRAEIAAIHYRRALDLAPDLDVVYFDLCRLLAQQGQIDHAKRIITNRIADNPDSSELLFFMGNLNHEGKQYDLAIASFRTALSIRPDFPEAFGNLGLSLLKNGDLDRAISSLQNALTLNPRMIDAYANLGNALHQQHKFDQAISAYEQGLEFNAESALLHDNIGFALHAQNRVEAAIYHYRLALAFDPNYFDAYVKLGVAHCDLDRLGEAIVNYRWALLLNPDHAETHGNYAMMLLKRGELIDGWEENEWRWATALLSMARRDFVQPQWRGEVADGQTLLIHSEQGFGDTLQFCRYAQLAAAHRLHVILQVEPSLVRLLRSLPGAAQVIGTDEELPPFDLHCPMLSMPLALKTTLETIPSFTSYLSADSVQQVAWQVRLAALPNRGLRVGLVWAGNPRTHNPQLTAVDRRRSMPAEKLAPLIDLPGLHFFSLQKDGPAAPAYFHLTDFMGEMEDFSDTAALIANLDLVISVDTAIVHLAAALGKPVWLLNRFDSCWRWLHGRNDSPWYPTMRIFKQQTAGDWEEVVTRLCAALVDWIRVDAHAESEIDQRTHACPLVHAIQASEGLSK